MDRRRAQQTSSRHAHGGRKQVTMLSNGIAAMASRHDPNVFPLEHMDIKSEKAEVPFGDMDRDPESDHPVYRGVRIDIEQARSEVMSTHEPWSTNSMHT